MNESIAAIIAQWGGFGAVLLAVAVYAYTLQKDLGQARKEHLEEVSKLQAARVDDAKSVTQTLLGLQREFNAVVSATSGALDGLSAGFKAVEETMRELERKVDGCDVRRGGRS